MSLRIPSPLTDPRIPQWQRDDYNAWRASHQDELEYYAWMNAHNARTQLEHDEQSKHIAARTRLLWS